MDMQISQTSSFQELIEILSKIERETRLELEHTYKTPTPVESMLFVISEIGEYADALVHNTKFARNDPSKERAAHKELAQVLFMTLTVRNGLGGESTDQTDMLMPFTYLIGVEPSRAFWDGLLKRVIHLIHWNGLDPQVLLQSEAERLISKFGNTNNLMAV